MTDRDAQVRRLAMTLQGQTAEWALLANRLYDAGARMPEPAPPPMPMVSEEACRAYMYTQAICSRHSDALHDWCAECRGEVADGLRAAFPIMLRDSVARFDIGQFIRIWDEIRADSNAPAGRYRDALISALLGGAA